MTKMIFKNVILKFCLSTLLCVIILLPLLPILLFFFVLRYAIYAILRIRFGSKFWGLLGGFDVSFLMEGRSKNLICILITARTNKKFDDFMQEFKEQVKTKIFDNPQKFSKLLATHHEAFGFHYLIKDQVKIEECIGILKVENTTTEEISKEELLTQLDNSFGNPLPYNHTGLCEFLVCEKPLICNKLDKTERSYAILARIHHTVGDGISLIKCLLQPFENPNRKESDRNFQKPSQNRLVRWKAKLQDVLINIFLLLMIPITILIMRWTRIPENNSLDSVELISENFLVAKIEETNECLKIMKDMKKRNNNMTFSKVLITAVSKSFSSYYQKKGMDPNLTSIVACIITAIRSRFSSVQAKSTQLSNNYSFINLNVPIFFREDNHFRSRNDMETEEAVKKEFEDANLYELQVFSIYLKLTGSLFPVWFLPLIWGLSYKTLLITNLPGPLLITPWHGCSIEDITVWVPFIGRSGISLSVFSYDKRLQIALTVNKSLKLKREDAQSLVDGIHRAIIEMDSQV